MQRIFALLLSLFSAASIAAQTTRPITQWVMNAKTAGIEFERVQLFSKSTEQLSTYPELQA
jgi:hypothetical protein